MSDHEPFELIVTPRAMIVAPESTLRRLWRRIRRRPAPTIQPEGTRPMMIEVTSQDGLLTRYYIPAAHIETP